VNACVLTRIKGGRARRVLESVRKIDGVRRAVFVWGRYDLVAFIEAPLAANIASVAARINAVPGIKSTETLIELAP